MLDVGHDTFGKPVPQLIENHYGWQLTNDHLPQGYPEPMLSTGLRYPRSERTERNVMDTYESSDGYLQAQVMDTYKLKRCVPVPCSKFHNMYAYVYYVITVWSVHLEFPWSSSLPELVWF